jgi:hypothetical protein
VPEGVVRVVSGISGKSRCRVVTEKGGGRWAMSDQIANLESSSPRSCARVVSRKGSSIWARIGRSKDCQIKRFILYSLSNSAERAWDIISWTWDRIVRPDRISEKPKREVTRDRRAEEGLSLNRPIKISQSEEIGAWLRVVLSFVVNSVECQNSAVPRRQVGKASITSFSERVSANRRRRSVKTNISVNTRLLDSGVSL